MYISIAWQINSQASIASFTHQSLIDNGDSLGSLWSWINELVGISKVDKFSRLGLLEQINTTADKSDYLWYSFRYGSLHYVQILLKPYLLSLLPSYWCPWRGSKSFFKFGSIGIKGDEPFLDQTVLQVESRGHAFHAFINGKPVGEWRKSFF